MGEANLAKEYPKFQLWPKQGFPEQTVSRAQNVTCISNNGHYCTHLLQFWSLQTGID
jgi:hypothetical protein